MNRILVGMAAMAMMVGGSQAATARSGWQCVTYAASHSLVVLRGDAHTWWEKAEGVYARAHQPVAGSVMVMKASGQMPLGHVAIVSRIVGAREVLLTHANWHGDGSVETNVKAIDVSPAGDWSQVRVWYAPVHAMGMKSFATYGFILPVKAGQPAPATAPVTIAPPPSRQSVPVQLAIADPQS